MRKIFLIINLLLPFVLLGKDNDAVLPSWFGAALADPDTYVGVAPPCDNAAAAEDMAIATALLHYMFDNGGYEANIVGELKDSQSVSPERYSWLSERTTMSKKADVIVSDTYINSSKECFVACKIIDGSLMNIEFKKEFAIDEITDAYRQTSAFEIKANIRRLNGRTHRTGLSFIAGMFEEIGTQGNLAYSLMCDGIEFRPGMKLTYGNAGRAASGGAQYPIGNNLGTALYNLYTAFPANIPDLKKRVSDSQSSGAGDDDLMSTINLVFEQKGTARPSGLRVSAIYGDKLCYSLDQQTVKEKFEKEYADATASEKYNMAFSSNNRSKYGFGATIANAYIMAMLGWSSSNTNLKGRTVKDEVSSDGYMSATESTAVAGSNFNLIYHIGDGNTELPAGTTSSDFDYTCGVTLLNLESKEERLAALKKAMEMDEITSSLGRKLAGFTEDVAPARPVFEDVDRNIPFTERKATNTFAVVIANEKYEDVDNVPTATNDGKVFCEYLRKVLGVPAENIYYYPNATYGKMNQALDRIKKASTVFRDIDVIYYYAGHGVPDNATGAAYLLPVDANPGSTAACLSVEDLYRNLAAAGARSVTVFLDACFSGSARGADRMLVAARGVRIKPKVNKPGGNLVVFSACSGDETAHSIPEAHHGVFTYHLLEKLRQSQGAVTLGELSDHLSEAVPRTVFRALDKVQTPTVATGSGVADTWRSRPVANDR